MTTVGPYTPPPAVGDTSPPPPPEREGEMTSLCAAGIERRYVSKDTGFGQFLNPEAMLTPGVAGALVMMIANSLASNFPLSRAYTGLCLSFVCGLLVLVIDRQW